MYECPNCGGNLKFDIASQMLSCGYCDYKVDPYQVQKDKDAEESTEFEVTTFSCPQCGGEIYSTDTTAAAFCSYCGASTILTGRLKKEKKPDFIIPFTKTKEDCKTAYLKKVSRAFYAPKELKNSKYIDSFRGIYMPYYLYHEAVEGSIYVTGTKSHRSGDYIITDHYKIEGNADFHYQGLSYDSSSAFSDDISQRIQPFNVKGMKGFTPSMLSGFYADVQDVNSSVYEDNAKEFTANRVIDKLESDKNFSGYSIDSEKAKKYLPIKTKKVDSAMFPVWFMAYKNKDRVAYATVNGQTGKVNVDLPISIGKFLLFSLITGIILTFPFNAAFTLIPSMALLVIMILSFIVSCVHLGEVSAIDKKDKKVDDEGYNYAVKEAERKKRQQAAENGEPVRISADKAKKAEKDKKKDVGTTVGLVGIVIAAIVLYMFLPEITSAIFTNIAGVAAIVALIGIIIGIVDIKKFGQIQTAKGAPGSVGCMVSLVVGLLVLVVKPVSDLYYYAASIVCLVAVAITLIDLISKYNILATRPLPQFDYRGGDDRA